MASDIIVKVGADITDFSRKMAESNKALKDFTSVNQETFDAFKKTGAVITGAGAALSGGLGFAVKTAANFESAMSSVAAISGATGKDFDMLSAKAREMGATTSFSATDAAKGLEYMALAGWDTQQMLSGIESVLYLAEAGALDLGRASDLVTDSMSALGIEVQNLDGYLDKVAQTSRKSNTDIDALMEALIVAGGKFRELNIPLEESNAMLGILANRGFKGSEAGRAMNAILTRLTATTGPSAKALEELGVSAFDSQGNFRGMEVVMKDVEKALSKMDDEQRSHYQTQIAGLDHGKAFSAMLDGLGNEYDSLKGDIEGADGALIEMRDTMKDNLQGALENLSSAFEEMMISIGTALLPAVKQLTEWLQKLADWFNGLSDSTKETIAIASAVAAALMLIVGPILLLIGFIPQIIAGFTTVMTVIKAVGKAIGLITSPIGLIVVAVIGLAYLIYRYWDEIKEFTINAWNAIAEFFSGLWTSIKETAVNIWSSVVDFFTGLWDGIKNTAKTAWQGLVDGVMAIVQPFIDGISNIFNGMKDGLQKIMDGLKQYFGGVWDLIKNIFLGAVLLLFNLVTGNFEELRNNAKAIFENIKEALRNIWEGIKKIFSGALSAIWGAVKAAWENVKSNTTTIFNAVKELITKIWNGIKTFFTETLSNIWSTVKQKFSDIVNSVREKMNDVKAKVEEGWNKAKAFLEGINLLQIGKDIIQGLIDGIKSKITDVKNAIKDVTDAITGKIKGILGIASPSKVLAKIGRWTGEGLAKGIEDSTRFVERATEMLAEAATPDVSTISLAYDTPVGIRSSLSQAVNGTVDVNTRDDMLAGAIASLERKLTNLTIVMNEREVARATTNEIDRELGRKQANPARRAFL